MAASQGPGCVHEGQDGQFQPGCAEVPDGVRVRCMQEIDAWISEQQHILECGSLRVIRQRHEGRAQAAFG